MNEYFLEDLRMIVPNYFIMDRRANLNKYVMYFFTTLCILSSGNLIDVDEGTGNILNFT